MYNTVFFLVIIIPLAGYILEQYLIFLNNKMWSDTLPEQLKGICPDEEYRKSQLYDRDNKKLSFWSSTFNLMVILVMIIAGGFSLADEIARHFSTNLVYVALIFFIIIGLASEVINIPFNWYDTFVVEKKYGFNTMTTRTFITDYIKSWVLALILGLPVMALLTWFYYKVGSAFWYYAWGFITIFSVFINFFYSELIVPLFNKQTPLPAGTLRDKIEHFANKTGFN